MAKAWATPEQIDVYNACRKERYATDADYREKVNARSRAWKAKNQTVEGSRKDEYGRRRESYATDTAAREKINAANRRQHASKNG